MDACKKIYKEKNRVRLQPANKNLTPFIFNSSRVAVQGIVIDVIKNPTSHTNITFKEEKQVTSTDRAIYKFEDLKNILGKPYFETANCLIYNMDCINAMQKIKNTHHHIYDCFRSLSATVCTGIHRNEQWQSIFCFIG